MSTFHSEWQRVLGNLRVQVWKAAIGEADPIPLRAASDDFIQFGMAYESLLNELPTAMPIVSAFVSALGSPNVSDRSAAEWHAALSDLIKRIDVGLQQSKESAMAKTVTNSITVNGGTVHSFQVGDDNTYISNFAQTIDARIEASQASAEQKEEARSLLKRFVEHPLLNTLLGVGLNSVVS